MGALVEYLAARYPTRRVAVLQFLNDPILSQFFEIDVFTEMPEGVRAMGRDVIDPHPHWKYYFVASFEHGMLDMADRYVIGETPIFGTGGVRLYDWLTAMMNDDPSWTSASD